MITFKQLKLFEVFAKNPFAEHTRKSVKRNSREKSNNALALTINSLKKEGVVLERQIGRSGILTLNLDNDLTINYIALCNNNRIPANILFMLDMLKKELSEETPFYSIALFGSYAINEQKKDSDVDIAIFIESKKQFKRLEAIINGVKLKTNIEMDIHIISKSEIIEMLINDEENLGKQIARKHLTICNHKIFYDIMREGFRHGFRVQNLS